MIKLIDLLEISGTGYKWTGGDMDESGSDVEFDYKFTTDKGNKYFIAITARNADDGFEMEVRFGIDNIAYKLATIASKIPVIGKSLSSIASGGGKQFDLTNKGEPFRVISTVVNAAKDAMQKLKESDREVKYITFSVEREEQTKTKTGYKTLSNPEESKRYNIYKKYIEQNIDIKRITKTSQDYGNFYITVELK